MPRKLNQNEFHPPSLNARKVAISVPGIQLTNLLHIANPVLQKLQALQREVHAIVAVIRQRRYFRVPVQVPSPKSPNDNLPDIFAPLTVPRYVTLPVT